MIIVDDVQPAETVSNEERQNIDWWNKTLQSRGDVDTGKRVIVISRLHEEEGWFLQSDSSVVSDQTAGPSSLWTPEQHD